MCCANWRWKRKRASAPVSKARRITRRGAGSTRRQRQENLSCAGNLPPTSSMRRSKEITAAKMAAVPVERRPRRSPDMHAVFRRDVELLARLHVERAVPGIDVVHDTVDAEAARGMGIADNLLFHEAVR